jgi:hypothetical protein
MGNVSEHSKMWEAWTANDRKDLLMWAVRTWIPWESDWSWMVSFENISPEMWDQAIKLWNKQDAMVYIYYEAWRINQQNKIDLMELQTNSAERIAAAWTVWTTWITTVNNTEQAWSNIKLLEQTRKYDWLMWQWAWEQIANQAEIKYDWQMLSPKPRDVLESWEEWYIYFADKNTMLVFKQMWADNNMMWWQYLKDWVIQLNDKWGEWAILKDTDWNVVYYSN